MFLQKPLSYGIYLDDRMIYRDEYVTNETLVMDPHLHMADNEAGYLDITIPPTHFYYYKIKPLLTIVKVRLLRNYRTGFDPDEESFGDSKTIWGGRVLKITIDFQKNKQLHCEGTLGFLNDVILSQYQSTPMSSMSWLMGRIISEYSNHINNNRPPALSDEELAELFKQQQAALGITESEAKAYWESLKQQAEAQAVEEKIIKARQIRFGKCEDINSKDTPDEEKITYTYVSDYDTALDVLQNAVETVGGHYYISYELVEDEDRYREIATLNYIRDYRKYDAQYIEFGRNLLDLTNETDSSDFATYILPVGAEIEEEEDDTTPDQDPSEKKNDKLSKRYLLKDLPNVDKKTDIVEKLYLVDDKAFEKFGRIERKVTFEDADNATSLYNLAKKYMKDRSLEENVITVKAIDINFKMDSKSMTGQEIRPLQVLDAIRVVSSPHGIGVGGSEDIYIPVTEIDIYFNRPEDMSYTLNRSRVGDFTKSQYIINKKTANSLAQKKSNGSSGSSSGSAARIRIAEPISVNNGVNTEIEMDGKKLYFENGKLTKVEVTEDGNN